MKLSISVMRTREMAKSLKISEYWGQEKNGTTADTNYIIRLVKALHVYTQIFVFFLAVSGNKLQL